MRKDTFLKLTLLLGSLVVAIVAAELVVRVVKPVAYREPPKSVGSDSWASLLHRPSAIQGLAYELAPNVEKQAVGTVVRTNSVGQRDTEPLQGQGVFRVAVIGDSFTFGFGVNAEDTYPSRLERLLNEASDETVLGYDVANFGVGGYATRDEALVMKHKVVSLEPDVVIVGYVLNDPEIEPIQPLHAHYQKTEWWQHSNLLRLLAFHKRQREIQKFGDGDYIRYLHNHPKKWGSVVDALAGVGRLAREHKCPTMIVIFPMIPTTSWGTYAYRDLHKKVADVASENGLVVLDLYDTYSQHAPLRLRVSQSDRHPNPYGHFVAAQALHQKLVDEHLLPNR